MMGRFTIPSWFIKRFPEWTRYWLGVLLLGISLALLLFGGGGQAEEPLPALLTGSVLDRQNQPVRDAAVTLHGGQEKAPLVEAITQPDGR